MSDLLMEEIRCRCCRRLLGVGTSQTRIYCDRMCAEDIPVSQDEARDALIRILATDRGWPGSKIGQMFGITRQRVNMIVRS